MEEEDDEKQYFAITHFEEAELRRVYDLMCSFAITNNLKADIAVREEALSKLDPKVTLFTRESQDASYSIDIL